MKKSNFLEDIQKLQTSEDAQVLLEFDSTECVELSLIQRAKLFVKLKYSLELRSQKLKQAIGTLKFKKTSNLMIND